MSVPTIPLPAGERIPVMGQGTWHMAENPARRAAEISALRLGLDLGLRLIDTAEMYAEGETERLVGQAITGRRDDVFLVSKVLPTNATYQGTLTACRDSLRRLGTDRLDLYLLHWRGRVPLQETVAAFAELTRQGMIRHWGVSNFDLDDMTELAGTPGGADVQTDQVLYNLVRRGIELDLLPTLQRQRVPVMAYSPIEQGRLLPNRVLSAIAARHDVSPVQVALAWLLTRDGVCVIPRASSIAHVHENRAALEVTLTDRDLRLIDDAFPPPRVQRPLEML